MSKNFGITEAENKSGLNKLFNKLILTAFADEGEGTGTTVPPTTTNPNPTPTAEGNDPQTNSAPTFNFEQMIAQARKEEKEKLYPEIVKLRNDLKVMTTNNNNNLLEIAKLKEELAQYKNKGESEEVTKLKEELNKVKTEYSEFKKNTVSEEELRATLEKEFEVKTYLSEQKIANKDNILPMFLDTVSGETKEDIDASIQKAIEMTNKAKEELGATSSKPNTDPNPATIGKPPVANPNGTVPKKDFDLEAIRKLDPRSPEYAEWRKSQGLR